MQFDGKIKQKFDFEKEECKNILFSKDGQKLITCILFFLSN